MVSLFAVTLASGLSGSAFAASSPLPVQPVVQTSCADLKGPNDTFFAYPLYGSNYPGGVNVVIGNPSSTRPYVQGICLEQGWTVENLAGSTSSSIKLRFYCQGNAAIDFQFDKNRTDVRFL